MEHLPARPHASHGYKPYDTPMLVAYGAMATLTQSGGSNSNEGGNGVVGCEQIAKRHC